MVAKVMGIDHVIDDLAGRLGDLERAYLIDDYAEGKDTGIIDLVLVGDIDPYHLNDLSRKSERYETFEKCQFLFKFKKGDNFNHRNTLSISRIKI